MEYVKVTFDEAMKMLEESVRVGQQLGNRVDRLEHAIALALVVMADDQYAIAKKTLKEALRL